MRAGTTGQNRDHALSEVIGFVLLLALVVAAVSLWTIYIVPVNGREAEIVQMNSVKDRFTDYKFTLDSLWINNQSGVTTSTSFNLGTGQGVTEAGGLFLPLLNPIPSSAVLSVKDDGDRLVVNSSTLPEGKVFNLSVLEYQSGNNYWVQQRYYYQTGGVFLKQDNGSICRISPSFTLARTSSGTSEFASVTLIPIQVLGGSSIGGKGPVRVDSQLRTPVKLATQEQNSYVSIRVDVADKPTALMWMNVLNETRVRGGITSGSWYSFSVTENPVTKRGTAFMNITGPSVSGSTQDIIFTLQSVDYAVTINNIASGIT
ncbi:hypothetical protein [Methanoregula formicica]|uniref:Archaeal flagellin-like protein n=1 Tax=Methanoregula formicica (strain DSM 22288 / NBRC 105244 / SMSP) TaxID=593750 RepID=L0HFJ5_METFS|nr:hypothetical protein [Methanoregula formicica]AGB01854.1 hypothetical protein Metfor_0794 [Methanoregula formicica SMSP]